MRMCWLSWINRAAEKQFGEICKILWHNHGLSRDGKDGKDGRLAQG
jgi:hypothetical protein